MGVARQELNQMSLEEDGCINRNTIEHEFMHALGFEHEQSRPDRDQHVIIHYDNIEEDVRPQFHKIASEWANEGLNSSYMWMDLGFPYDEKSVMHYEGDCCLTAEAEDAGLYAITDLDGNPVAVPEAIHMSVIDVLQLAKMYESFCPSHERHTSFCNNGESYLTNFACDGTKDCSDGTDEKSSLCDENCVRNENRSLWLSKGGCLDTINYLGRYELITDNKSKRLGLAFKTL